MEIPSHLDKTDQTILQLLSVYDSLNALELWYELGECDPPVERLSQAEVLSRLQSLRELGLVQAHTEEDGEQWCGSRNWDSLR